MKISRQLMAAVLILILSGCSGSTESPEVKEEISTSPVPVADSAPQGVAEQERPLVVDMVGEKKMAGAVSMESSAANRKMAAAPAMAVAYDPIARRPQPQWNTESYNAVIENGFITTGNDPLSTFSIDVDTASYANIRRFINQGALPPLGAVRIEEMINYFSYSYPQPTGSHPFSVTTELGPCPWNENHQLVRIGLAAKKIDTRNLPPSNLVFLIDVSGSMSAANKLPLLKQSMKMLVGQLDKNDRVSIVVYAGNDCIALEPTAGSDEKKIFAAIDSLGAGGSTHASSGIVTAYRLAEQVLMPRGNNRVILASDGDFNVGTTSRGELLKLIEEKRKSGVYLTVLGFGMGNYNDDSMELLADKGNGNYGYIDSLLEAKKVMVKEMSGTLFALAGDVKIQVEFNPAKVGAYRLLGYENRALADEDFNNDKKDAGEIGVGHTVTAIYELIPAGAEDMPSVDSLKYQRVKPSSEAKKTDELMTLKLRYKPIRSQQSTLLSAVVRDRDVSLAQTSDDFRFASSVAGYGMLLSGSEFSGKLDYEQVLALARDAKGTDREGYRAEFIRLVEMSQLLPQK
ncbi:MAG: VWA domain-containing protein [Thermodesulfobacteriota bacterium]